MRKMRCTEIIALAALQALATLFTTASAGPWYVHVCATKALKNDWPRYWCADNLAFLRGKFAGDKTSWSDVTCQEILNTTYNDDKNVTVNMTDALLIVASSCCESGLARCLEGFNRTLKCNKFSETEALQVEETCVAPTQVCVVTQAKGSGKSFPSQYLAVQAMGPLAGLLYAASRFAETRCAGGEALFSGMCQTPEFCDSYKTEAATSQGLTDIICNSCTTDRCNTKLPAPAVPSSLTAMCSNEADFDASNSVPNGPGCEAASSHLLGKFAGGKTSWSDVTCQEISTTTWLDVNETKYMKDMFPLASSACCGTGLARCRSSTTTNTPAATPAPVEVLPKAPEDTKHYVTMTVTMSLTKAEFDKVKNKYKAAIASAAGTDPANVEILNIIEVRRRAGSIKVETKVRLGSECTWRTITSERVRGRKRRVSAVPPGSCCCTLN